MHRSRVIPAAVCCLADSRRISVVKFNELYNNTEKISPAEEIHAAINRTNKTNGGAKSLRFVKSR